ncbi:MAG: hypothetical protein HUJ72_12145 [Blautia sp.]|nr:hypothetical protein [Blautia sp.]
MKKSRWVVIVCFFVILCGSYSGCGKKTQEDPVVEVDAVPAASSVQPEGKDSSASSEESAEPEMVIRVDEDSEISEVNVEEEEYEEADTGFISGQ